MAEQRTIVHVDTPRPGPRKRIDIRLHPESRAKRWGPRGQKLLKVPPPLIEWASENQKVKSPAMCRGPNANISGQDDNSRSFSSVFGNLHDKPLRDGSSTEDRIELNQDALRSHDIKGDGDQRASESDEESSSSKRSRDDMEEGLEGDDTNQLKKSKMEGKDCNLNIQYSLEKSNNFVGSGNCKETSNTLSMNEMSKEIEGTSTLKRDESSGNDAALVVHEDVEGEWGKVGGGLLQEEGKGTTGVKKTGIHKALQKQMADKKKITMPDCIANIRQGGADSTEESEDEKETWNKVVESLTSDVGELESVQSLSNQLKNNMCSPPTGPLLQSPAPIFMHPWGLFPFRPIGSFGPFPPPYWLPPPVFYPYSQPVPVLPPEMQFPVDPFNSRASSDPMSITPGCIRTNSPRGVMSPGPEMFHSSSSNERMPPQVASWQRQSSEIEGTGEEAAEERDERSRDKYITPGRSSQPPRRKVYVPGQIKQMKEGKCDLSRKLKKDLMSDSETDSFIGLMKQESSVSVYSPARCSGTVPGGQKTPKLETEDGADSQDDTVIWRKSWRGDAAMLKALQASAPPAISNLKIPKSDLASYSDCIRGNKQWETCSSRVSSRYCSANMPKGQLVARIQPRRRLTLQEEVMMNSIPKSFHQHFGLPASSSETVHANVVYPWSDVEYIDTHCHIDFLYQRLGCSGTFEKFGRLRGFPDNYGGCVAIFCTPESFHPSNEVWQNLLKEDKIWAAFGCHPHHVKNYDGNVETNILKGMMHKKAVAFGEIGLDYSNRNDSDHILQHMVFRRQLAMALQLQKPLVIHSREAESDTLDIMVSMVPKDYKIHRHCFTGPPEDARAFLKAFPNSYIGITNLVTFPTAVATHCTAQVIPLNKLLLETDAPYFLPRQCPRELRWSHPAMAVFVAEKIARLKGITTDEVLRAVRKNTRDMYGI